MRMALSRGLFLALAGAAQAGTQPPVVLAEPPPLYATPTRLDRIGRVIAPVIINGHGPFRLVVDTGASHSTLSPEVSAQLGLTPSLEAGVMLNGVTGAAQVPTVHVDEIKAGDMVVNDVLMPVLFSSIMSNADGILGIAGLRDERVLMDFRKDRIVISRSWKPIDVRGFIRIPAMRVAGGLFCLSARIGGVATQMVIDTGAEQTLGNLALRDALRKRRRVHEPASRSTEVYGATADVAAGESEAVPPIQLGAANITSTRIVYGDFHIFKVWGLQGRPAALIGMDVLGTANAIVIDYVRRDFYVDVGPNTAPRPLR